MKKIITSIFLSCLTAALFGQANTYFHDRIDTTLFAIADTVGHGANHYYATNLTPDFNVKQYVNGCTVNLFFKKGNTGSATLTLVTKTATLSSKTIRKANGQVLLSGDIPDSTAVILDYYNGSFRIAGIGVTASSSSWLLTGNSGTTAGTNFLGTTDAVDLVLKTNNTEKARISSAGILSLGLASTNNGSLLFRNSTNANTLTVNSGVTSASYALTLPNAQGAANSLLLNDGAGTLSWNTGTGLFWGLTGNAGTVAGTNFIGTTDNIDLVVKRNSIQSAIFNSTGTGFGLATPTKLFQVSSSASHDSALVLQMNGTLANFSINRKTQFNVPALISAEGDGTNSNWLIKLSAGHAADSNAFCVTGQGIVGAGMHPQTQFSVRGNNFNAFSIIAPSATNNCGGVIYNGNTTGNEILYMSERSGVSSGTTDFRIQRFNTAHATAALRDKVEIDNYYGDLALQTTGADRLRVYNASGYVGVGTTSAPSAKFQVTGEGATSSTFSGLFENSGGSDVLSIRDDKIVIANARFTQTQGADVASLNGAIAVGFDGNVFELTGANSVTLLTSTGWQNGTEITFVFTSTATIVDGTANSGTDIGFENAGNANFVGSDGDVITYVLSEIGGTVRWREKSRSVN